ncbi:MAG: flagellar motor switch protein FliG [Planctomycetia bacterium]|nr:flagellar motor switch protein FliG [Planctomycetia bacterium]
MGNDLRKAAVLLMSLPQEEAAQVMGKLLPKQVEAVSIEIAKLGSVTGDEQASVINEFANAGTGMMSAGSGGLDVAKSLVEKALGKNAGSTLDNMRQQIEAVPFGFLHKVDSQNLLTFIVDEHPQTIALILAHLPATLAASILGGLPSERQLAVVRRVANMGQTNPEIIKEVEQGLSSRMSSIMSQQFEKAGGVPQVAQVLNVIDRATERALLENLAQEDPELVEEIRRLMFVFEDINKLANKDLQTILKNVETSQWALALKGASEELRTRILGNMSERAAAGLKEEIEFLGAVKRSAVEQMQQQIVDVVRKLQDAGEITVNANEADEPLVQ